MNTVPGRTGETPLTHRVGQLDTIDSKKETPDPYAQALLFTGAPGLPHPFTSPPTSLSYCLGLVVGVRVFDCLYIVAVVSTMSKYI